MTFKAVAAATVAFAISAAPAFAASLDLSALGLRQGALIAESDQATVFFDGGIDFLDASVSDGVTTGFFDLFPSDPTSAFLNIIAPVDFAGPVVAFDIDPTSAVGLFRDEATNEFVYAVLTLPTGTAFDFSADTFEIFGATAQVFATTAVPLPAAAPLMLAGLGALAVAARRRRA